MQVDAPKAASWRRSGSQGNMNRLIHALALLENQDWHELRQFARRQRHDNPQLDELVTQHATRLRRDGFDPAYGTYLNR